MIAAAGAWLLLFAPACDRRPTAAEEDLAAKSAATAPATDSSLPKHPTSLEDYRKLAEAGDVSAMILLGRAHETMGTASELQAARKWFAKAAATGNTEAQQAIKDLDARRVANASNTDAVDAGEDSLTAPPESSQALRDAAVAAQAPGATTRPPSRGTGAAKPPSDPTKLSWTQVVSTIDTTGFVDVGNPNYKGKFVGLTTAPDKTITVAATGVTEDDLVQVTIVLRMRNRQDIAGSLRVQQAAQVAATVTRGYVTEDDFNGWIAQYMSTGQKSTPIFRNGWGILITGTAAARAHDLNPQLGEAIVIEMKK
jgi:hypothetical protein